MKPGHKIAISIMLTLPVWPLGILVLLWGLLILMVAWLSGWRFGLRELSYNVMYSVDQLGNACLGGDPDETISSRAGRAVLEGRCKGCKVLCWLLDIIDKDHCHKFVEGRGAREVVEL